jgi:hypothetical protein
MHAPFNELQAQNYETLNAPKPRSLDHDLDYQPTGIFHCRNLINDETLKDENHIYLTHEKLGYLKIKVTREEALSFGIECKVMLRVRRQHIDGRLIACIAEISHVQE